MDITANSTTEPLNEGGGSFTGDNRISSDLRVARIRHQDGQTLRFTSHSGDSGSFTSEIAANGALRGLYVYWATAVDAVVFQYGPITGNESAASFRLDVDFGETIDMPTAGALCYLVIGSNTPAGGGVEIDLAATGATGAVTGSATLTVTAAPPPGQINLAATGATGAVSGSATLTVTAGTPALTLADFDTTGLEVDAAALNVASADASPTPATFYADSDRGGTDAPLDGDIGVGPDDTPISRIRRTLSGSTERLGLNDNGAFDLGAYFDSGGDGNDLTVWIQTLAGIAEIVVADSTDSFGSNFIQFSLSTANQAIIDAIDLGDRYIFAVTRPAAGPQIDLAATGATGAVSGTATLTVTPPPTPGEVDLAATGATGAVRGTATLTVTPLGRVDLAATGSTGSVRGTATLTVSNLQPGPQVNLAATGSTGAVEGTATLSVVAAGGTSIQATRGPNASVSLQRSTKAGAEYEWERRIGTGDLGGVPGSRHRVQ